MKGAYVCHLNLCTPSEGFTLVFLLFERLLFSISVVERLSKRSRAQIFKQSLSGCRRCYRYLYYGMSQVAASCPRLPVEIWEEVLAYNLCDDHTLANCSLVCRTWSPTCRMHRFREIKVKPRPVGHPQAASLLCDPTSTVLPYVHSLTLIEGLPEMDLDRDDRDPITLDPAVGYTSYWFDDVLPKIRTRELTALERLSVQAIQWESLSSSSRKSVVDLCPRLRSLEVVTWDPLDIPCVAIIQLFDAATLLKHFTLRLPEPDIIPPIDPDDLPPPSDSNATLALESFQIDNAVGCYLKGLPFHFSTLCITKVTINGIGKNDVQALLSFITLCSASLQHLSLQLEDPYPIWGEVEGTSLSYGAECSLLGQGT